MFNFFDIISNFINFILDSFNTCVSFVLQFVQLVGTGWNIFGVMFNMLPSVIGLMMMLVLVIAFIKLLLSLVGVII